MRQLTVALVLGFLLVFLIGCDETSDLTPTAVGVNGIPISPEFQTFYQANGGRAILGDPLTELFTAAPGERPLQYFQNVRLEYNPIDGSVLVSPLGIWELGGLNEQVLAPVPQTSAVRTFPNTSFTVQDEFLNFYENHDGVVLLGSPISPQLNVDGLRVQYFENGRLEWHPEAPTNRRIQLGNLGQTHFDNEMTLIYQELRPARPVSSAGITNVVTAAYLKAPILYHGEDQVLYATVKTLSEAPVSNVVLDITLSYTDGTASWQSMPTDDLGQVAVPIELAIPPGEEVTLHLVALNSNGTQLGKTVLTYKTWW